jgi:hypothetical protein
MLRPSPLGKAAATSLSNIAKRHDDLRREYEPNGCTHNQGNTDDDVVQIAGAVMPMVPSNPSSDDPCCETGAEQNHSSINQNNHKEHTGSPRERV